MHQHQEGVPSREQDDAHHEEDKGTMFFFFTPLRGNNGWQARDKKNIEVPVRKKPQAAGSKMMNKFFMMLIIHATLDPG